MLGLFPKNFPWSTFGLRESDEQFFSQWKAQRDRTFLFAEEPLVSIVVTGVDLVSIDEFRLTLDSIRRQSYGNWEAWVVGFSPQSEAVVRSLGESRFHWTSVAAQGIALQKNEALKLVQGEWVGFVAAGDVLSPVALYHCILEGYREKATDVIYANEAWLDPTFKEIEGFFSKREFSWFSLIHFNYVGTCWLVRRALVDVAGPFDPGCEADHIHEFLLRLACQTDKWCHIPYFLTYRRKPEERELSVEFTERLKTHVATKALTGEVKLVEKLGENYVKLTPTVENPDNKLISVVICFRDKSGWTIQCLDALLARVGKIPIELILVNNESLPSELSRIERRLEQVTCPFKVITYEGPFNFAHMHNLAIREHCRGDLLFFLNNDVFVESEGALDELAAWALVDWVGTVGMLLKYPYGGLQHDGIRATFGGADHMVKVGHFSVGDRLSRENREVFVNTFAACMVRRAVYQAVGGLRELDLANGWGDVAFSLECIRRDLHNVFLGHVEAIHLEAASRGKAHEQWEEMIVEREYPDLLQMMLRSDLGWNRVPSGRQSLGKDVQNVLWSHIRESTSWLDPIKPTAKKILRDLKMLKEAEPNA